MLAVAQESAQKPPPPQPPSLAGCWLTPGSETKADSHRDFVQADILDRGPHNRQAAVLGGEDANLIGALPHEASETFDGIGGLNMPVHGSRKCIERQGLLFLFSQASHRFGIAFAVFGECSPPIGVRPPACWVAAKSPRVLRQPQYALVWGSH